ncbi:MAG: hypothetical protein PF436_09835 [Prolixibacteraceae bacterium]|jgi:predicted Fe-Mo cluster-binding NifX family protein|nr:hypothetical protein [Prolixibacteraceae bacterium]
MIIAIPIEKEQFDSTISTTFARSNYFAIVDKSNGKVQITENLFKDIQKGAGIKLFHWLIEKQNIDALLAFEMGYKMQQMATEASLQIIIINEHSKTLNQLLEYMNINPKTAFSS